MTVKELEMIQKLKAGCYSEAKINALIEYQAKIKEATGVESDKIKEQIAAEMSKQKEADAIAEDLIASLNDNDLESVMIYRFLMYLSIEKTAEKLYCHPNTIKNKTKKALKKLCP